MFEFIVPEMGIAPSSDIKSERPTATAFVKPFPAFAVTVPEIAGRETMVTLFPTVTVPMTVVTDGACTEIDGIVTTFTLTTLATVTVDESAPEITGALNVTTVGVSVI
jgi:hypothetical protein